MQENTQEPKDREREMDQLKIELLFKKDNFKLILYVYGRENTGKIYLQMYNL